MAPEPRTPKVGDAILVGGTHKGAYTGTVTRLAYHNRWQTDVSYVLVRADKPRWERFRKIAERWEYAGDISYLNVEVADGD